MKKISILLIIGLSTSMLNAQTPSTNSELIEGGKLILEIIKIFKPEKKPSDQECLRSICFENLTEGKIKVTLNRIGDRKRGAKIEIISLKGGNDCSYSLKSGIYAYEIKSETDEILKKAELNFIECTSLLIKVSD